MKILAAAVFLIASANPLLAQDITQDVSATSKLAKDNAKFAGSALFCKFDKDKIEEFIALSQIKITRAAKDREDLVIAKMDFTNAMIIYATIEPSEGCQQFQATFRAARSLLQ